MRLSGEKKLEYPPDRVMVDVMKAARDHGGQHVTEQEVVQALVFLYNDRGLKPGTKNGPRAFRWFPTVVGDYFETKVRRDEAAQPCGYDAWNGRNQTREERERFEQMTDAIELPDTPAGA
jgi:hypothetical protein